MKKAMTCFLAFAAAFGLNVCAAEASTLVYGSGDYTRINPAMDEHGEINILIFNGLTGHDGDNQVVPGLAKSWEFDEDTCTYTFHLEEGVKWHDGEDFTAEDVKFTIEAIMDPENGSENAPNYEDVQSIDVIDDHTIAFQLDAPNVAFLDYMTMAVLPEHLLAGEDMQESDFFRHPIGTGPYKIAENDDTTQVVLVKNEDYHGGEVNLDELDIIFYDDDQTKLIAYENGDIDLADLNASLLSQYEANYADEITAYHPLGTAFISLNLNDQYLSDVNVRKAISLAINREELVSAVLNGAGIPATSYLNNGIPGHDDSLSVYEYDPEQAKALLAEAGYADGITISSEVRQADQAVFSAIQGYLAEVGINLDLTVVDNATYNSDRTAGKIPMTGTTWNALYPDGDFQMYNYFYSNRSDAQGVFYKNDDFDKLLDEARKSTDETARADMYKEADKILSREDYACIPLYYPQSQFIAKPYVKNYKVGNLIYHFWNVDVDTAAQNQ